MIAYDRLIKAAEQLGRTVKSGRPGVAMVQCPAHDDHRPSLSIRQIRDRLLVYCFAGCPTPEVLDALGLSMPDLFDDRRGTTYPYADLEGRVLREVHRSPDKQFRQTIHDMHHVTLYRLPEITRAVAAGRVVWLVEGEQDADLLVSLGVEATTAPQGGKNFDKVDVSPLKGADVRAVVDRDEVGDSWAADVRQALDGVAEDITLWQAVTGKDATDHLMAGHALDDFSPYQPGGTLTNKCIDCREPREVKGLGRCHDCQLFLDQMDGEFATPEVDINDLIAQVEAAVEIDAIIGILANTSPPRDALEQQRVRERLIKAMKGKASAPAKVIDGWLKNEGQDSEMFAKQSAILVQLVKVHNGLLFHTPDHTAFVALTLDGHREVLPVRSRQFKLWLSRTFWEHSQAARDTPSDDDNESQQPGPGELVWPGNTPSVPGSQAVADALTTLEGEAVFGGPEHEVHIRVAHDGNKMYLDLGNENWEAVEIDEDGWRVVSPPPVMFRRPAGLLPLPHPERGGTLDGLRPFLNVADADWPLILGAIVGMFSPGPFPVLVFLGEQGTAKSTATKIVRRLIDPNTALLRRKPRSDHDLAIAANNGWVITGDNLSSMPVWLSDALCTLATGGGFATRQLYSDTDEQLFDSIRPIILNGIGDIVVRSDLLDRAILIDLEPIVVKRDEATLWDDFDRVLPGALGAALDAVSIAIGNVADVVLPQTPRMVDFARWVTAAETTLGLEPGEFLACYLNNRTMADATALDSSPIARFVRDLVVIKTTWEGTATELLTILTRMANDADGTSWYGRGPTVQQEGWPKAPNQLSNRLKQIAPNLRRVGVEVVIGRDKAGSRIVLRTTSPEEGKPPSPSSPSSPPRVHEGLRVTIRDGAGSTGDDGPAPDSGSDDDDDGGDDELPNLWHRTPDTQSPTCTACGDPLNPVLAAGGHTTHPLCDPDDYHE